MSDKPSDSGSDHQETLQEEVQDYLDMLLTQATEQPAAQVNLESRVSHITDNQGAVAKIMPSLTMVAGRPMATSNPQVAPHKTAAKRDTPKLFAEPVKPITLKMPIAQFKQEAPLSIPSTPIPPAPIPPTPKAPLKTLRPEPIVVEPVVKTPEPVAQPVEFMEPEVTEKKSLSTSVWLENGRPSWGQGRFECLLFSVGGLTLAVPLSELGTIYPITEELTPIFGQIDWFMGLLPVKQNNIKTVNTAKVVMPERYCDSMMDNFSYVISINGVDWGLAVDKVSNAITLDPTDVRWRGERSKRPWLAGTVVEHMCALLDVSQLAAMFIDQDQPR